MKKILIQGLCLAAALFPVSLPGWSSDGGTVVMQERDLKLSFDSTTLKVVADAITSQAGIAFSYDSSLADYPMENGLMSGRACGKAGRGLYWGPDPRYLRRFETLGLSFWMKNRKAPVAVWRMKPRP